MSTTRLLARGRERGMTVVVVLVLLTVMLLGGLALARMTETGSLVFGNVVSKDATLQASEAGINEAFSKISAAAFDQENDQGAWYKATYQQTDANGIPQGFNFDNAQQVKVGTITGTSDARYDVRYVVERMCGTKPVTDILQQCLVRLQDPKVTVLDADRPKIDPANMKQFRITVRVTDLRGTTTWVQTLATVKNTVGS